MFILGLIIIKFAFSDVRNVYKAVYGARDKLRHWPHFGSTDNMMIHRYIIVYPSCVICDCAQTVEIKISKEQQEIAIIDSCNFCSCRCRVKQSSLVP
jgi:hypothetical protein